MSTASEIREHIVTAGAAHEGCRLDKLLATALAGFSRSRLKQLIDSGQVRAAGRTIDEASYRVKPGERFVVTVPSPVAAEPQPQSLDLAIVYEDDNVLVLDKPAGLVVHPAPGNPDKTLVNALLAHCSSTLSGIGGVKRPGIVHRIDKDTSGLLVVAKNDQAHMRLAAQFSAHSVERSYLVLVWGVPKDKSGEIDRPIGRNPADRKKMAVVGRGGKPAVTRYRVARTFGNVASLIECRLKTGRTHQIRVHLAAIGHPVVGDRVYGKDRRAGVSRERDGTPMSALRKFPRQALHAASLGFIHPTTGELLRFVSELPQDIRGLLSNLE